LLETLAEFPQRQEELVYIYLCTLSFFFSVLGFELALARQVLSHSSHVSSPISVYSWVMVPSAQANFLAIPGLWDKHGREADRFVHRLPLH
jgi:hypothetical protein